ncbi:hypothetical protein AB0L65_56215 [Nonomuraea sp. NPDC052116]|uniref:hypothetical protein n=1 Tax=Nonomuraea sp. NPDC052116 TaxID=3155665 RepID=UPI0034447BC4
MTVIIGRTRDLWQSLLGGRLSGLTTRVHAQPGRRAVTVVTLAPLTRNPVDVAADACRRFAAHLDLPAHQPGEACLDPGERARLAAAPEAVEKATAKVRTKSDAPGEP